MSIRLCKKLLTAFAVSLGLLIFSAISVHAATFSLSPASGSTVSGTFVVTLNLTNLGGKQVSGADIYLNYEPNELEVQSINVGSGIFTDYPLQTTDSAKGVIAIGANVPSGSPVVTPGKIVTITFKALRTSGSTTLSFDYTPGSTIDSNIVEAGTGRDILTPPPMATYSIQPSGPFVFHLIPIWNRITWLAQLPTTFTSYLALDHIENCCPRPQDPPRAIAQRKNGWWESAVHGYGGVLFDIVAERHYHIKVASACDWPPGS
jgi:hypothetical protein